MPLSYDSPEMIYVRQFSLKYYMEWERDETTDKVYPLPCIPLRLFIARYNKILSSLPQQFTQDQFDAFEQMQEYLQKIKLPAVEKRIENPIKVEKDIPYTKSQVISVIEKINSSIEEFEEWNKSNL